MEHHEKAGCLFPKIGMRNVKTALAAALCALVYYFLDRNPTFALSLDHKSRRQQRIV